MTVYTDINKRHDFVILFDVENGNPNGDPDAGNLPRVDPETMHGLVTDVCLKRKIRNYVALTKNKVPGYEIYVEHQGVLNNQHERAWAELQEKTKENFTKEQKKKPSRQNQDWTKGWMCKNFYDIRTFGAVMSTEINCGQVRGPVQMTFARSKEPIVPLDMSITRVAVTKAEDAKVDEEGGKVSEMGRKSLIPYGLYIGYGFINPFLAEQTGFSNDDLSLFWDALTMMFELDRSASKGLMSCRGLYVFTHENKLGKAPSHKLFDLVNVNRKTDESILENEEPTPARSFSDYEVIIDKNKVPDGITLKEII